MQLIVNTETAVDIKTKMSLNEDNLEKSTSDVHSAAANGDIANGDVPNEDNEAGDSNKNIEQVIKNVVKIVEHELELPKPVISNNADIETSHVNDNKLNQAVDISNGEDDSKINESVEETNNSNENTATELVNEETKETNNSNENTATKLVNEETEETSNSNENTATELVHEETEETNNSNEKTATELVNEETKETNNSNENTATKLVNEETEETNNSNENTATELVNEETEETNNSNEKTTTELVNEETEHTYDTITDTDVNNVNTISGIEDEQNDKVSDSAMTDLSHESSVDIRMADGNENAIDEKKDTVVVYNNTKAESTDESMTITSITDAKERSTMETETENSINTEAESYDDDCTVNNITAATESVAIEKEDNDVSSDPKCKVNSKNVNTNITVDQDKNGTNAYNVNCNEDASPNIIVDPRDDETTKTEPEAELNIVKSTFKEREIVSIPVKTISSEEPKDNDDMMPEIDSTVNSMNDEAEKVSDESDITETSNINVQKENVSNAETNSGISDTEQHVPVSVQEDKMETDMNDENIDLIKLNVKNESVDILECVKKELEAEERGMMDIEEKEAHNNDEKIKLNSMDVDEIANNPEVELEVDVEASARSFSDVNKSSNKTFALDEPISVQNEESVDLIPDSSDDVIFNLDDDKEQEKELVEPKASESTKIIEDNNQVSGGDDDKTILDPKQSDEIIDLDENVPKGTTEVTTQQENTPKKTTEVSMISPVLKLSNTLDILSDEEDELKETNMDSKCISIEDDDDVMLIDEDTCGNEMKSEPTKDKEKESVEEPKPKSPLENMELGEKKIETETKSTTEIEAAIPEKEVIEPIQTPEVGEKIKESSPEREITTPLLHEKFLKTCKKNLSEMTREELEEFCILKIVESVIDRSSLSEVKSKLKTLTQNIDEYNKKAKMLTKQNRDLQVVLKSIQEDQKKGVDSIVPLKITRSVGMQVLMTDKVVQRRKGIGLPGNAPPVTKQLRNPVIQSPRPLKPQAPQIPVPRLVPANNPTLKSPSAQQPNAGKITSPLPNGIKNASPVQKGEKRPHNRIQSVTVDLTDDEPPAKVVNRTQTPVVPPVRLVPSQNLLAPPRPSTINSPRKVYIPISGPQGQNVRAGQTIMLKTVPPQGTRQRCPPPHMVRMPQNMRLQRPQGLRHPAPLPDCMKQYQPPNWKALPPAPDLKLAKVENGIVISWKIEGYQEDSYEEIASYQLYAYQETASPPNTALWKKIGDVKALPLPMACTLTQFMAGYKYYFAVRAVDIRSRLGPFSLPGSILLLNKM